MALGKYMGLPVAKSAHSTRTSKIRPPTKIWTQLPRKTFISPDLARRRAPGPAPALCTLALLYLTWPPPIPPYWSSLCLGFQCRCRVDAASLSAPKVGLQLGDFLPDLPLQLGLSLLPELASRFLLGSPGGFFGGGELSLHFDHRTPQNDTAEALHLGVDHLYGRLCNMCDEGRLARLDCSGHRGQDALLFRRCVEIDQGAQQRAPRTAQEKAQWSAQNTQGEAKDPPGRGANGRRDPGCGGEVLHLAFLDPQRAIFHPLHDSDRVQSDAPLGVGVLEFAGRLVGFALFLEGHEYDVILGHGLSPFSHSPSRMIQVDAGYFL